MMKLQAVFLDRDGTIGGTGHFIHPRDFVPYPFAPLALKLLHDAGIKLFGFTNQHNIALGKATAEDFAHEFQALGLDGAYICPHAAPGESLAAGETAAPCGCRKPAPGLLLRAAREHGLDLTCCAVIGDVGATDMLAAAAVGAVKVLVRTGWGEGSLSQYRQSWAGVTPDYVATDLLDAARWLLRGRA